MSMTSRRNFCFNFFKIRLRVRVIHRQFLVMQELEKNQLMSSCKIDGTSLPPMRYKALQIPVGSSPGFLSNAKKRQGRNALNDEDKFSIVHIMMNLANVFHRSVELTPNRFDVRILLHPYALTHELPSQPLVLSVAFVTLSSLVKSNSRG